MRLLALAVVSLISVPALAQEPAVDPRAALTEACMAEAKRRATVMEAVDLSLVKVRDTDIDGGGKADMTARVEATFRTEKGKLKRKRMTMSCEMQGGIITEFRME